MTLLIFRTNIHELLREASFFLKPNFADIIFHIFEVLIIWRCWIFIESNLFCWFGFAL